MFLRPCPGRREETGAPEGVFAPVSTAPHRRRRGGGPLGPSPPQPPSAETARLVMRAGGALWHATHYISTISIHKLPAISSEPLYMISMYFNHLSATLPQSRESCTRMHFYGCFCTCGRVAIRCYEQYRPSRLILVHDPLQAGTAAARQRGAAATSERGPGGSGQWPSSPARSLPALESAKGGGG